MQHTLIPGPERAALRHEYRLRVLIVLCFMLSFAGVIGVVSLFPSFLSISEKEHAELAAVSALNKEKEANGTTDISRQLSEDQQTLNALSTELGVVRPSLVIQSIVSARGSVSITALTLKRSGNTDFVVSIQGVSPTRDALQAFQRRLEQLAPGNKAFLPISELARGTDIQYSIQLTEKLP